METRFSLDEPMDIDKFHNISLKACDDYVKDQKALSDAIEKTKRTINDEQRKVWAVINRKAETIHRIIAIVAYTICCVLYILCWLYLIFSSNVTRNDLNQASCSTSFLSALKTYSTFNTLSPRSKHDSNKSSTGLYVYEKWIQPSLLSV